MPEAETLETCDNIVGGGGVMSYPCQVKLAPGEGPGEHPGPCMAPENRNSVLMRERWEREVKANEEAARQPRPRDPQFDPQSLESQDLTAPRVAGEMTPDQAAAVLAQTQGPPQTFQEAVGETDAQGRPKRGAPHPAENKGDWDPTTTQTRPGGLQRERMAHLRAQTAPAEPGTPMVDHSDTELRMAAAMQGQYALVEVTDCPECGHPTDEGDLMTVQAVIGVSDGDPVISKVDGRRCSACDFFFVPASTLQMTSVLTGPEPESEPTMPDPHYRDPNTEYPDEPTRKDREGDTQPLPIGNDRPSMHDEMAKDLEARKQLGIKRYGQPLQPLNGREAVQDAYEESLDMSVYLRQLKYEHSVWAGELRETAAMLRRGEISIAGAGGVMEIIAGNLDPHRG
jgi:hypothetical protein